MAGGGGSAFGILETGEQKQHASWTAAPSLLRHPHCDCTLYVSAPVILALCLTFFIIVSLAFEHVLHRIHHKLTKKGRTGMLSALDGMKNEVMLLGFASLMLMALEGPITSWCGESTRHLRSHLLEHAWPRASERTPAFAVWRPLTSPPLQCRSPTSRPSPTRPGWTRCPRATAAWLAPRMSATATSSTGWPTASSAPTSAAWLA